MLKKFVKIILYSFFIFGLVNTAHSVDKNKSIEYKLAVINSGKHLKDDDITVKRFGYLIKSLSSKYVENQLQIADMSVAIKKKLEDDGVQQNLLEMMEGMNKLFSGDIENQKYGEYLAAYYSLRVQGYTHPKAINGLKELLQSLGVY